MKKVLFIVPTLSNGGAERVVSVLASGLVQKNYDAIVLRFYKTDEDYKIDNRVKVITLCKSKEEYDELSKFVQFRMMRKVFNENRPDNIIPFLRHVNIQAVLAAGKWFKKVIYTIRVYPLLDKSFLARVHDFLINHTNKTIVQNREQKECYKKLAHNRIYVLNNPVDERFLDVTRGMNSDVFTVVSAGRLSKQKNFSMLIKAFSRFAVDKNDVLLNIYGVGDELVKLQNLIKELDCQDKIKMMGRSNHLESVYSKSDLYVMSSNYEGMPNALLEAMAAGLPCISTDCKSGPKEMINNNENGLIIPTGDEDALVDSMNFMYYNRDKAERMAKQARQSVAENYRTEKIVDEFLKIIEN